MPLYAEQPVIANIIHYRGFGNVLLKEEVTLQNILESLNKTLQQGDQHREAMRRAVRVLQLSPVTVEDNLLHHVRLLMELGELPYLENQVLEGKSMVDVNNLDVLSVLFVAFFLVFRLLICLISYFLSRLKCLSLIMFLSFSKKLCKQIRTADQVESS